MTDPLLERIARSNVNNCDATADAILARLIKTHPVAVIGAVHDVKAAERQAVHEWFADELARKTH